MIKVKRLFLAIKIQPSPKLLRVLEALSESLKHEHIRWVNADNLHLTLRFFGEINVDRIESIKEAVSKAIDGKNSFNIEIEGLGMFGSSYHPKLLWLGISNAAHLANLEGTISKELDLIGFKRDRQNFVPHLTICRLKQLKDRALFMDLIKEYQTAFIQEHEVKQIILYESILQRTGPDYKVIQRFDLGV